MGGDSGVEAVIEGCDVGHGGRMQAEDGDGNSSPRYLVQFTKEKAVGRGEGRLRREPRNIANGSMKYASLISCRLIFFWCLSRTRYLLALSYVVGGYQFCLQGPVSLLLLFVRSGIMA